MKLTEGQDIGANLAVIETELARLQGLLADAKRLVATDKDALTDPGIGQTLVHLTQISIAGAQETPFTNVYKHFHALGQGVIGWNTARANETQRQAQTQELVRQRRQAAQQQEEAEAAEAARIRGLLEKHPA